MVFKPHKDAEGRKKSAIALIKLLLNNKNPDVLEKHRNELLSTLLWKITEQHGKHNTIYKSQSASRQRCNSKNSRHDHVYTRKELSERLLKANSNEIDDILNDAIACVVTPDEHNELSKFDRQFNGWDRYDEAEITVIDMRTGKKRKG